METKQASLKYGAAAVIVAIVIIAATTFANPMLSPQISKQLGPKTTLLVMLTDPPDVPKGTTQLNLTYSEISLHVKYSDNTSSWVPVQATGKVNLLSLLNVSQTLASIVLPTGSIVDKIQFGITSVEAKINNVTYPVTALTDQLLILIRGNGVVTGTISGVLLDFRPTLVQISATNSTGDDVDYYVLVPSATAIVKPNINERQKDIGSRTKLDDEDNHELDEAKDKASRSLNITSASLTVNGTKTYFTVTIKNVGNTNQTIFGLILHGNFNDTNIPAKDTQKQTDNTHKKALPLQGNGNSNSDDKGKKADSTNLHPRSIPFKVNGTSLIPQIGKDDDKHGKNLSSITLKPGQTVTVSFNGVIQKQQEDDKAKGKAIGALTPVPGSSFTIRLIGEGYKTYTVNATSTT